MYQIRQLDGAHLPDKTLCLTYDDGPGEHTLAIARFLHGHHIRATFFVVGKYAIHQPALLSELRQMNHIIGNHTYEHPDLPYYISVNGDAQQQVLRTDAIIRNNTNGPLYFRAPYGKWSEEVANELNANLLSSMHYVGPVNWDIAGIDCYFWQQQKTVSEALQTYLQTIAEKRKGIVVMHDEIADMDILKPHNRTLELTRQLIPLLLQDGYRFVGLDEMDFPIETNPVSSFLIRTDSGRFLQLNAKNNRLYAAGKSKQNATILTLKDKGNGRFTLQLPNGHFVAANEQHEVGSDEETVNENCFFHLVPVFNNRFIFRTRSGHFLQVEKSSHQISANAPYIRLATVFTCQSAALPAAESLGFFIRKRLFSKKIQFIKRKLLSRFGVFIF